MVNGLEDVNDWVTRGLAIVTLGVGIAGTLSPFFSLGED
jgi:hypothetical protein